jgi:hypothetical protein
VCLAIGGNPLTLPHPKAVEIAVATRRALDQRLIQATNAPSRNEYASGGWNKRDHASGLALLKQRTNGSCAAGKPGDVTLSCHVVLIDTSETILLQLRGQVVIVEARPAGPCDTLVATTLPGLQALLTRNMGLQQAIALGLLSIDGDQRAARLCLLPESH